MRIFVTGAGGHIASAVIPELVDGGHQVVGLVRSDASAEAVAAMGAEAHRGDLNDLDGLAGAARDSDGVIHLAFDMHGMGYDDIAKAAEVDQKVIAAVADQLAGRDSFFIGIGHKPTGDPQIDGRLAVNPRFEVGKAIAALPQRGIRAMLMAIPPVTHSSRDVKGFIPTLIGIARRTGVSGYLEAGENTWPAAHTLDVGRLYRLAAEQAPAGTQLIAATEAGIPVREIAEAIAAHLGVPAQSIPADQANAHFGAFGDLMSIDLKVDNSATRELLGWEPSHPGLIADLDAGHYFAAE